MSLKVCELKFFNYGKYQLLILLLILKLSPCIINIIQFINQLMHTFV
jgi:hypothetical protein